MNNSGYQLTHEPGNQIMKIQQSNIANCTVPILKICPNQCFWIQNVRLASFILHYLLILDPLPVSDLILMLSIIKLANAIAALWAITAHFSTISLKYQSLKELIYFSNIYTIFMMINGVETLKISQNLHLNVLFYWLNILTYVIPFLTHDRSPYFGCQCKVIL